MSAFSRPQISHWLPRGLASLLWDCAWVLSFGLGAGSYRLYRATKRFGNWVMNHAEPIQPEPDWPRLHAVIDGYRHSGNKFITGNVLPELQPRIASVVHRPWMLRQAVRHNLPCFLLVRDPLEAALSRHFRSHLPEQATYGLSSSLLASLLAWYLYYGHAWALRHRLVVLPFPMLTGDYPALRARMEAAAGPTLRAEPDFSTRNAYEGPRPAMQLSPLQRLMLRACRRRYAALLALPPPAA